MRKFGCKYCNLKRDCESYNINTGYIPCKLLTTATNDAPKIKEEIRV